MEQLQMDQSPMKVKNNKPGRVHRVGSITTGLTLVVWGIIFFLYEIQIVRELDVVIKLWPLILIGLGIELLWFNSKSENIIYDKGSVFIMILMTVFSMVMAVGETCIRYLHY